MEISFCQGGGGHFFVAERSAGRLEESDLSLWETPGVAQPGPTGYNSFGQLGDSVLTTRMVPVAMPPAWNSTAPVTAISAGLFYTVVLAGVPCRSSRRRAYQVSGAIPLPPGIRAHILGGRTMSKLFFS